MSKKVIGIIGPIASGKNFAANYLGQKFGVEPRDISDVIRKECTKLGLEPNRENLISLGGKLSKKYGNHYLVEQAIHGSTQTVIVSGMREPGQIDYLKNNTECILIAIQSDPDERFKRTAHRNKLGEAQNLEDFIAKERKENSPPNPQDVFKCIKLADFTVTNSSTLTRLEHELDRIAKIISKQLKIPIRS